MMKKNNYENPHMKKQSLLKNLNLQEEIAYDFGPPDEGIQKNSLGKRIDQRLVNEALGRKQ